MQISRVNIGQARQLSGPHFEGNTGIFKEPVSGPVDVGEQGLTGDDIIDRKHHGGPDQAVYLYRQEDYDWWSEAMGHPIEAGTFGDNLTLQGLPAADIAVGARLKFPNLELEVSAPRIPCNTLAQRMGEAGFVKQFIQAERPGIYCRVITPGTAQAGDSFSIDDNQASEVTIVEMLRAAGRALSKAELEHFLAAPIDIRSRTKWQKKLSRLD